MNVILDFLAHVGASVRITLAGLGAAARTFVALMLASPSAFRRPRLVTDQVHFIGNYSLVIIAVSGLFVGFVLGLQGYYTLNKYGSEQALGLLVALSLIRELGPVVTALLFAGRAGTSLTAEIGLMKAGEQLAAMEMMAVEPIARVVAPRFWGGVISMPLLAALFSALGIFGGYVVGVRLIGNIIWLVLCGFAMAVSYAIAGIVMCILIVTIPFGIASFRIAGYALWPFGRTLIPSEGRHKSVSVVANILWFVLVGWWLALLHLLTGDVFDSTEALRLNFVQKVVPAGQERDEALRIAQQIGVSRKKFLRIFSKISAIFSKIFLNYYDFINWIIHYI